MARTNTNNPTHVPSAELLEKERQVLELKRAGFDFSTIAERVGFADKGGAHKAYKRAISRVLAEPVQEVRDLEADRLDRLQASIWAKAITGHLPSLDRVLHIMRQRADLLGLNHSHGIAERALQVEQEKIRLVAFAVGRMFDALELTAEQKEIGSRILLEELRGQAETLGSGGDVVPGELADPEGASA